MISELEQDAWLRRLTFPSAHRARFQEDYYSRLYKTLRVALALLALLSAFWTLLYVSTTGAYAYFSANRGQPACAAGDVLAQVQRILAAASRG
jgi:hypothetical protein